jgi:hypothetical protein
VGRIVTLALLVVAFALAALAGVAGGQPGPRLHLAPNSGAVGTSVLVRGSGFSPRVKGIVVFGTRRVAVFRADRRGGLLVTFVVPAGRGGHVRLTAEQLGRGRRGSVRRLKRARARFTILAYRVGGPGSAPGGSAGGGGPGAGGSRGAARGPWAPPRHLTWYWQLQGTVNNSQPVAAYDIDGFDNTAAEVATLHAQGKHVICYIDAGTYEPGRPDASRFPPSSMGAAVEGWPGERWLDVRALSTLEPIMSARFAMCREKGFDAVEPDNIDGYSNNTGFPLTAQQQLTYNEWIAGEAHSLGLAVFQKNDGEQTGQLQSHFDGALNEQCNQYSECASFQPYLAAGKPVLNAEYGLSTSSFCAADNAAGIMGARYSLALNGSTFEPCW